MPGGVHDERHVVLVRVAHGRRLARRRQLVDEDGAADVPDGLAQVDRHRRRSDQQAGVQHGREIEPRRQRDRHTVTRPHGRRDPSGAVEQLAVRERAVRRLDRRPVRA